MTAQPHPARLLIIACGALAREIHASLGPARLDHIAVRCLPATLHNRPERIAGAVQDAIAAARGRYDRIFVAYGDCGTGGALDRVLAGQGIERLPGPHCYAFYTGNDRFAANSEADMRSFFLTDFLARQFDTLVIKPLGLDRHPELRDAYFGHYEKLVFLAQTHDDTLLMKARSAADRLGLVFEHRRVGYGDMPSVLDRFVVSTSAPPT